MNHPIYNGIKVYSRNDVLFSREDRRSKELVESFSDEIILNDINQAIEYSNAVIVYQNVNDNKKLNSETKGKIININASVARYFNGINEDNFQQIYDSLAYDYIEEFFQLLDKYKVYKN